MNLECKSKETLRQVLFYLFCGFFHLVCCKAAISMRKQIHSYISDCEVQGHCFSKSINSNPIVLSTIKYSFEICPEGFMVQFSKVDSNADLTATVSNFPISLKIRFKFKCHFFTCLIPAICLTFCYNLFFYYRFSNNICKDSKKKKIKKIQCKIANKGT